MGYFVRLVTKALWPDGENVPYSGAELLSADTITNDLRTNKNTLSWWKVDTLDDMDIVPVASALAASLKNCPKDLLLVAIPEDTLRTNFSMKNSPGDATVPIDYIKEQHFNSEKLNYDSLKGVADFVARGISSSDPNIHAIRFRRDAAIDFLEGEFVVGRVETDLIKDRYIRERLGLPIESE